jgi:hypothetical protein
VAFGPDAQTAAVLLEERGGTAGVAAFAVGPAAADAPAWAAPDVLRGQAPLCLCAGAGAAGRVRSRPRIRLRCALVARARAAQDPGAGTKTRRARTPA